MTNNEQLFKQIEADMLSTYVDKNADYGDSFTYTCDKFGLIAAVIRINDKVNRLNSITKNNDIKVKNESLEDTLKDLANYCIMTLIYLKNGQNT